MGRTLAAGFSYVILVGTVFALADAGFSEIGECRNCHVHACTGIDS